MPPNLTEFHAGLRQTGRFDDRSQDRFMRPLRAAVLRALARRRVSNRRARIVQSTLATQAANLSNQNTGRPG